VYVGSPYVQREHGIGGIFSWLFLAVKPVAIRDGQALRHKTLNTEDHISTDIVNKQPETQIKNIVDDRLAESAHNYPNLRAAGQNERGRL